MGTTTCWYLTILSVLVSWTLHPGKRKSGSIDVDLIAILTLPTVAAGHLISQASTLMHRYDSYRGSDLDPNQYCQYIAAIEAPFTLVETFMAISVIMFIVAVWMFCLRRAILVATIGLLCLVTECYIHFSRFKDLAIPYKALEAKGDDKPAFSRSFVADFTGLVIAILVILGTCAITTFVIVIYLRHSQKSLRQTRTAERRRPAENQGPSQEAISTPTSNMEGRLPNTIQVGSRPIQLRDMGRPVEETTQLDEELTQLNEELTQLNEELTRLDEDKHRTIRISAWISLVYLPATVLLSMMPSASNAVSFSYSVLSATGSTTTVWSRLKSFVDHFYPHSSDSFLDIDQAVASTAGASILGFSIYGVANAHYKIQIQNHLED